MRRQIRRLLVVLPVAGYVLVAGSLAGAQEVQNESTPPPSATAQPTPAATPAPTPAPTAVPAPLITPAPVATPDAEAMKVPAITPWPMEFPWSEEAGGTEEAAATESEAAGPNASGTSSNVQPAIVPDGTDGASPSGRRGILPTGRRAPAPFSSASGTVRDPAAPVDQPVGPGTGDATTPAPASTAAIVPTAPQTHGSCESKAYDNGLQSDAGAILQVAVQNDDCTWGGTQVLVSYDARGPPAVDVLVQSTGMTVDVEAYVTQEKMRLGVGYVGADGEIIPVAPRALGPLSTANQAGGNDIEVVQSSDALTGDATSGSQTVRVHVEGDARHVRVLAQNASPGASASTGDAVSGNAAVGSAGPGTISAAGPAQAGQTGSNDASVDQEAISRSGDALAGSQELDVHVTGSVGEVAVMAQNASPNSVATTGDALAGNVSRTSAGPVAEATDGPAQAAQIGNNNVDVDQAALATSGDAIASSQVVGITVGGSVGALSVLATNDAANATARSGDAFAVNVADVVAGPSALASNGDAASSQIGSNHVSLDQHAQAESGRALAGAQVISITVGGQIGTAAIMPTNNAIGVTATSGNAVAANIATGDVGPVAAASGNALTQQSGSNTFDLGQTALPTTGDAVAGGQVVGIVEGAGAVAPRNPALTFEPGLSAKEFVLVS